jgi:hypothetical protein
VAATRNPIQAIAIFARAPRRTPLAFVHGRDAAFPSESRAARTQERAMKELSVEEVLRIAGGVPGAAALDEVTYRAPAEPRADPVDYAHLVAGEYRAAEPR